jgi:hypothetical protein
MNGQEKAKDKEEIAKENAAAKAHGHLKKLSPKSRELLGFKSDEELKQSLRGDTIAVYMIALDDLEKFKPKDDPKKILLDLKMEIFPIYSGKTLKSSITIRKKGAKWEHVALGGHEIHIVEPARTKHSKSNKMHPSSYFVVRIPAMYLIFLGYYSKGKLYLIPSHEHPDLTLVLHEAVLAEKVLLKLQSLVEKYKNFLTPPKK